MDTLNIATFEAAGRKLRAFVADGSVWIIGADIITGLNLVNPARAYVRLGDDERRYVPRMNVGAARPGKPMVAVSESGFYKLVLRSDKPEALAFQEWVTREVLPAIRRTGGYRLAGVAPEAVEEGTVAEMPDVGGIMAGLHAVQLCVGGNTVAFVK